jgi:hypothetical protein
LSELLGLTGEAQQAPDVLFERSLGIRLTLKAHVVVVALNVYFS